MNDEQRKAMFAKQGKSGHGISSGIRAKSGGTVRLYDRMGTGAKVQLVKRFGINDVPVGTHGIIKGNFGGKSRPIVLFDNGLEKVMEPENLLLIKGSSKHEPTRFTRISVGGDKDSIERKLKDNSNVTSQGNGWFTGYEYLDDGEGRNADVPFTIQVVDGAVNVKILKSDIPHRWKSSYEGIREGVEAKVKSALGIG